MSNSDNLNRMLAEAVAAEIRKDAFWLEYNLKIDRTTTENLCGFPTDFQHLCIGLDTVST